MTASIAANIKKPTVTMNGQQIEPLSVNIAEATRLLGFKDAKSTRALIREGKIKARKSGRIFLVNFKSLKAYVGD